MLTESAERSSSAENATWYSQIGIPVKNLWMLLMYASDLAEFVDEFDANTEDEAELPELLARVLVAVVERRLRKSLSRGYRNTHATLSKVRGRIDWLETESRLQLQRGMVTCRFEELTHDTPRNRLVRAALELMKISLAHSEVSRKCSILAKTLADFGVRPGLPTRADMSRDQIMRHEADDRLMTSIAKLALDLVLPGERQGKTRITRLDRDEKRLRRIFEKGVAGFYRHELDDLQWRIHPQAHLKWQQEAPTAGMDTLLPAMKADLILESAERRIVIDTKFTNILTLRPHKGEGFKNAHLYQLYAYLRSQTGQGDPVSDSSEGILLYPSVKRQVDEAVTIQGHRVRFVTLDLSLSRAAVRENLLKIIRESSGASPG